jgi:hypothetical protein
MLPQLPLAVCLCGRIHLPFIYLNGLGVSVSCGIHPSRSYMAPMIERRRSTFSSRPGARKMKIVTIASIAAGLVALSLPAHAASATTTDRIQLAQRSENPGGGMFRNENPGGGMYKKSKKKKKGKK